MQTLESISEQKPPASLAGAMRLQKIIGGEVEQPRDLELLKMTLLAIHDGVEEGLLEGAERAAESLVHQIRLLRLKKLATDEGIVAGN